MAVDLQLRRQIQQLRSEHVPAAPIGLRIEMDGKQVPEMKEISIFIQYFDLERECFDIFWQDMSLGMFLHRKWYDKKKVQLALSKKGAANNNFQHPVASQCSIHSVKIFSWKRCFKDATCQFQWVSWNFTPFFFFVLVHKIICLLISILQSLGCNPPPSSSFSWAPFEVPLDAGELRDFRWPPTAVEARKPRIGSLEDCWTQGFFHRKCLLEEDMRYWHWMYIGCNFWLFSLAPSQRLCWAYLTPCLEFQKILQVRASDHEVESILFRYADGSYLTGARVACWDVLIEQILLSCH